MVSYSTEGLEADDGEEQEQPREKRSKLEELHSFLEENEEKVVESRFSSPSDILAEIKWEMVFEASNHFGSYFSCHQDHASDFR